MNIEQRVQRMESANRRLRAVVVGMLSLILMCGFIAADDLNRGDKLTTPVEISTPSDNLILRIDRQGTIEFVERKHTFAKFSGATLNAQENALSKLEQELKAHTKKLETHEAILKEHKNAIDEAKRHMQRDQRIR